MTETDLDEPLHTGVMIALWPSSPAKYAVGSEPVDQLHVTLGFLGDADDLSRGDRATIDAATRAAANAADGPVEATVTGVDVFGDDDGGAIVLLLDGPALPAVHAAVWSVLDEDEWPDQFTPWQPHMTVAYLDHVADPVAVRAAAEALVGETIEIAHVGPAISGEQHRIPLWADVSGLAVSEQDHARTRVIRSAEFANPNHDELGRFARKGEGRRVPTKGIDGTSPITDQAGLRDALTRAVRVGHPVDRTSFGDGDSTEATYQLMDILPTRFDVNGQEFDVAWSPWSRDPDYPMVVFHGTITDQEGRWVGDTMRAFTRDLQGDSDVHAYHDRLSIRQGVQGQGIGTAFLAACEDAYVKAGITEVRLHANLDVGGYAWARAGFDFETADQAAITVDDMLTYTDPDYTVNADGIPDEYQETLTSIRRRIVTEGVIPTPYELSRIGYDHRRTRPDGSETWWAKEVMMDLEWEAKKILTPAVPVAVAATAGTSRVEFLAALGALHLRYSLDHAADAPPAPDRLDGSLWNLDYWSPPDLEAGFQAAAAALLTPGSTEFANPNHDELGRFARKGEGRRVPTKGVDHDGDDFDALTEAPAKPDLDIPTAVIVPLDGAPGPGTTLTWADGSTMTMSGRDQPSPPWSGVEVPELHNAWVYVDAQGRTTNVQVYDDLSRYSWAKMPHENPPTMGPLGPDGPPAGFHLDAMKKCIDAKSDLVDRLGMDPVEMTFGHPATEASEAATNRLDPSTIHIGEVWGYRPGHWAARQEKNRNPPAHMGGRAHEMTVMRDVSQAEYIVAHELGHIRYNRGSTQPGTVLGALAQASGDGRLSGKYADATGLDPASRRPLDRLEEEQWDVYGTNKDGFSTYASQSEGEAIAETHAQLVLGGDMGPGPTVIAETLGWLP